MKQEPRKEKIFTRRTLIVGALQFAFMGLLAGRLAWLQIVQGRRYKTLSDKNRINIKMIPPSRGQIVDRFGVPLAVNNQSFRVQIVPEQAEDIEKSLRILQKFINLEEDRIQDVLRRSKNVSKFVPLSVRGDLTWEEVAKIEVNLPALPGVSIDAGEIRTYPYGHPTAHVVGYVGLPGKADIKKEPLLALPGFKIGKTGIEKYYDKALRGRAGTAQMEVNYIGQEVRELKRTPSSPGDRVMLTIDGELQRFVQERLSKQRSASAVIMDAHSGAVYALVSHPGFDPNAFTHGLSASAWEELLADKAHPLNNKAIAGQYPPASTFKMITALAALKAGLTTRQRLINCPGHYDYGNDRFHCWKYQGHGFVNLEEALIQSCDVYFYQLATEIGIDNLADMARAFGLGGKTGIGLPEERPGLVPDKDWKMGYYGAAWKPGETIISSIGQGYFQATPLQLAVMTARLINGSYAVKPWISAYLGERSLAPGAWSKMDVHKWHLTLIKNGMDGAVNDKNGTAFNARIPEASLAMGGKTGTAQVKKITLKQRQQGTRNEDLKWSHRHHALFVGYAPLKKPRYVCTVVIEHGGGGSATAAPVAKDLLTEAQKRAPAETML